MKTAIVYGTFGGATEDVASEISDALNGAELLEADETSEEDLEGVELLVLGASTWNSGDVPTDMEEFVERFAKWNVSAKYAAVFGLGDQDGYGDTFANGMSILAKALREKNIPMVGKWPVEGYDFEASDSVEGDHFVGLAIDQDNQMDQTSDRIEQWAKQVLAEAK